MNKKELIQDVAAATDLPQAQAQEVVSAALDSIIKAVANGDKVQIAGFGTFEPRERAARTGRNPQTGAPVEIAASTAPAFKPAAAFKDAVNK
ncbi:HU family DNA-binding protein [Helcobacillus massiliensis]|uniref:DNA-binding protein HU-beta n=1 Tax=Helcobacillus massiliensis TaxID=521392 RepID=A0A839QYA6_9MICO|nr:MULTISPECIES: HU family DNA-binding protein [Helcobacillus]MBB3023830.1 DNA-binding protein HU-beta [Helcobacillus massiliensis]MCG7427853.1 HU family DNA-binding protein [Helcobacillus sp. ACRRO]MCT1558107.1 HU family DNA-binding protein [Helcobacillus massiliensis]MCT2036594.1 HU family DNA-binding protein [Helcobacillus massiliensis]MCT2332532.1 HU family DNA-binding protein [Helcobacillus massiliensis]